MTTWWSRWTPRSADQGEGLADQAARAVLAYREGDREPLAALVQAMTPLLWHTVRAQGADTSRRRTSCRTPG